MRFFIKKKTCAIQDIRYRLKAEYFAFFDQLSVSSRLINLETRLGLILSKHNV